MKTSDEKNADELLSLFDMACNLYYRNVIHKEGIAIIEYEMFRFFEHPDTQSYLQFLTNWQDNRKIGKTYESYQKYCNEH